MGTSGNKMKQLIAVIIAGIVLIFFIAAAATTDWVHGQHAGVAMQFGAFRFCGTTSNPPGWQYCYAIRPDCSIHGAGCNMMNRQTCPSVQPSSTCNQLRAVEAFLILALVLDAVVIILMCVVRFGGKEINSIAIHVLLGLICIFTIISFSVFINDPYPTNFAFLHPESVAYSWTLGAGPALMIVSWILSMANIPLWHIATKGTA